jgi:hypothetical protein
VIKEMNLDLDAAVIKRRIQISELEEMRLKHMKMQAFTKRGLKGGMTKVEEKGIQRRR